MLPIVHLSPTSNYLKISNHLFLSVILLLFSLSSFAQTNEVSDVNFPPPQNPPEIIAQRAATPINIDGRLDEPDWQQATAVTDFFRVEPRQGGPIRYATEVKFLYDEKNLYVGAFCKDSVGIKGIRVQF